MPSIYSMNPNNLYYHAIYGNTNEMNYILADIRDSLKPYLDFLTRAIDAEKERKVYAYFEFIEDEKTISLERLTKSYEVIATGEIECTLENDWYEVLNYDDLIRSYNLDFNQIDQLPLFWLNDEGLQQQILIEKNSINFVHFKSKFKEKDSSYEKDCVDDGDDEHHLFIRFEDKLDLDALKDIRYKRAKLELRKQLDSVDHVILTQSGNDIQVIDIKKKTASKLVIKFQGSIDPTIPLEINGYPIQFQILKSLSLTDIQRFTLESGNNERELNTRDIQRNFETGTLLIPKPNRGEILHAYNKNDEEITLSEIRIKKNTIIKYKENNHEISLELKEVDDGLYYTENFPNEGQLVDGEDGNKYKVHINVRTSDVLKIRLLEPEDESDGDEIAEKSKVDYFFEDDVEELMGEESFEDSKKYNKIFKIESKNQEQRWIKLRTYSQDSLQVVKRKLLDMIDHKKPLYINRNTYQLEMQKEFIETLITKPLVQYRPLLRLTRNLQKSMNEWNSVTPEDITEWFVLTNEEFDGTDVQQDFVKIAVATSDFAFLEGPPGSGKTTSILELIFQLINKKKKILFAASTHVAIDNVLERIKKDFPEWLNKILPLRIGDKNNISELVQEFQADNILSTADDEEGEFDSLLLDSANLVCGTTIGILRHPWFWKKRGAGRERKVFPRFDYLIMDETSKTTLQEFIIPALYAEKWILVGDIQQLAPFADQTYLKKYFENLIGDNDESLFSTSSQKANFFIFALIKEFLENDILKHRFYCCPTDLDTIIALKAELDIRIQRDLRNNIDLIKRFPYITFITEDLDQSQGPSNYYEITRTQILNGDVESLMMEGANILFIENSVYNQIESLIPSKFAIVNRNSWKTMQLFYRWAYFITHKNQKNDSQNPESSIDERKLRKIEDRIERINQDFQQKDWASEISWRLIRLYELRNMKVINRPYEKDLKFLLPRSIDLSRFLVNAWGIALPSILESIQKGTAEQFRGNIETIMKKGFPDTLFEPRHKKMTYQFRMHEQISEYPRLAFYNEEALINSKKILPIEKGGKGEREWKYKRYTKTGYKSRFTWINVESQISGRGRNINEVSALMRELRIFLNWAMKNPREDEQNWSVACLTYYRGQEKLIRKRLQELTNQSRKFANFNYENVDIVLHTVDKIQGSEADIVFLSMVRTCSRKIYSEHQGGNIGFMDNPNRLNVGLTRAKYQLVILGQLKNFEDQDISPHLKDLTQAVTVENENELEEHKDRQNWRENAKKRKDNSPNQNNRNWIDETSHRINAKADRERNNRKYNHSQGSNHSKPYKPNNPNNRNFKPDSYKRREQK